MSRFVFGNCIDVVVRIPDNVIDSIPAGPPYLVGFRDRSRRTIAGSVNDDWPQSASNEIYCILKEDAPVANLYGQSRADRSMAVQKRAGFDVVEHLVFTKNYASKSVCIACHHKRVYILAKGSPARPHNPLPDVPDWKYPGNRHHSTEKPIISLQPLIESFIHPSAIVLGLFVGNDSTCVATLQSGC